MGELSLVLELARVRKERSEAHDRAALFARHADRLEVIIQHSIECPCCEQFSCAEYANLAFSEVNRLFVQEWEALQDETQD